MAGEAQNIHVVANRIRALEGHPHGHTTKFWQNLTLHAVRQVCATTRHRTATLGGIPFYRQFPPMHGA